MASSVRSWRQRRYADGLGRTDVTRHRVECRPRHTSDTDIATQTQPGPYALPSTPSRSRVRSNPRSTPRALKALAGRPRTFHITIYSTTRQLAPTRPPHTGHNQPLSPASARARIIEWLPTYPRHIRSALTGAGRHAAALLSRRAQHARSSHATHRPPRCKGPQQTWRAGLCVPATMRPPGLILCIDGRGPPRACIFTPPAKADINVMRLKPQHR
ncbi:hypothetical protein DFH09DRAFT_1331117 [Mycena vulgaris]|nr:hypothetical protein DFH09DRAFT_1331117 [Mycena vulgaris]